MAITVITQDLENHPGVTKNVTVDQKQMVPVGYEGDEKFLLSFSTTAYSDNTNRTAISTIYSTYIKAGWCKSSGFAGVNGKFALDSTHCNLKVKLDATVSGSDQSGYYTITLAHSDGSYISGDSVAEDMETKIRAISVVTADTGFALSYLNASVEFKDGQFWVVSGSMGKYFTGADRSSVDVIAAGTNDCSTMLGFNLTTTSEGLANTVVRETILSNDYTTDATPLQINAGSGVVAGDCLMITDDVHTDYFTAISGTTDTDIVVATDANNNYVGIAHSYTTTSGARVQILREQDPDGEPVSWYSDIDSVTRWGIKSLINQIDYSS